MKKFLAIILTFGMLAWAGSAMATLVTFNVDGPTDSFVNITNSWTMGDTSISADLADLHLIPDFDLDDNESMTFGFFTLSVTGGTEGLGGFTLDANLNFDTPSLDAYGTGSGSWLTLWDGTYNNTTGLFTWNNPLQEFTLADGNIIEIAMENFVILGPGLNPTTTVHATVTNLGVTPVPEPTTILLLGSGLLGLVGYNRKRFSKKS